MSESPSKSGHNNTGHLKTRGYTFQRRGHLLQSHGQHPKTHGNFQKNANQKILE